MPQFILITDGAGSDWQDQPDAVKGFIEAMFFCNQCPGGVMFTRQSGTLDTVNACALPGDRPAFTKRDWDHPEIQKAIQEGQSDGEIPSDASVADLHPEALRDVASYVADWTESHADLVTEALARPGYDAEQLGRDLYFTSAGHGTGFWCRDELGDDLGERLSEAVERAEWWVHYESGEGKVYVD